MKNYVLLIVCCSALMSCQGQLTSVAATENYEYARYLKNFHYYYGKGPESLKGRQIDNYVRVIYQDRNKTYWFGTGESGLCRYDGNSFNYFTIHNRPATNQINAIAEDLNGNIWVATANGVAKIVGQELVEIKEMSGKRFSSIYADRKGTIWMAASDGLWKSDGTTFDKTPAYNADIVTSINEDKKGNIWLGTENKGIIKFDGNEFTPLLIPNTHIAKNITRIIEDKNGVLWYSTMNAGLFSFNGKTLLPFSEGKISNKEVWTVFEDTKGNIWFSSEGNGVYKYDGSHLKNYSTNQGFPIKAVQSIFEDRDGKIWIGGGGGLYKFDGQSFQNITTALVADGC